MGFFKQDLNLSMFILIVVVLFAFILSSFYYHGLLGNIQKKYELKVEDLILLEKKLLEQEKKLKEFYGSNNVIIEDKKFLERSYINIKKKNLELQLKNEGLETKNKPFSNYLCKATGNVKCLN